MYVYVFEPVSGNCTWTSHIEQMCSKANRVLGLVKRLCGRDIPDKKVVIHSPCQAATRIFIKCVVTLLCKTSQTDREHSEACH